MNQHFSFDRAVFRELVDELGAADTAEVLRTFLADTGKKLTALEASSHDGSLLKREAHSIKSSAATFGFTALSELARQIELGAATMSPEQRQTSIGELGQRFETVGQFALANLLGTG